MAEEEKYNTLKKFFESHIEQDNYDKLKDGYVVLDTSSNICYFKKITLDKFIKKNAARIFNTTTEVLQVFDGTEFIDLTSHRTYASGLSSTSSLGSVTVSV